MDRAGEADAADTVAEQLAAAETVAPTPAVEIGVDPAVGVATARTMVPGQLEGDPDPDPAPAGGSRPPDRIGRLVVLDALGEGAMGRVFSAYDPDLDRRVAVKLLHGHTEVAEQTMRVRREAHAMARLSHPNVVQVFEVGQFEEQTYIAMEYVDGDTLDAWLEAEPRSWQEVVDIFVQLGAGLNAAHEAGLIHRDFKPQNVLVGADTRPRIIDFGLARADAFSAETPMERPVTFEDVLSSNLTRDGVFMGTPAFMAPEQMKGRGVSAASDQFSFCVALYEALYGQTPFDNSTLITRLTSMESGAVKPPPAGSPVSEGVHHAILRGMAADPTARWSTMAGLCAALAEQRKVDRGAAWRERFLLFAGMFVVVVATVLVYGQVSREGPPARSTWIGMFTTHGLALVVIAFMGFLFRRAIMATRHNRRLAAWVGVLVVGPLLTRVTGFVAGDDPAQTVAFVLTTEAVICALAGLLVVRWAWWTAFVFAAGGMLAAVLPDYTMAIHSASLMIAIVTGLVGTLSDARSAGAAADLSDLQAELGSMARLTGDRFRSLGERRIR